MCEGNCKCNTYSERKDEYHRKVDVLIGECINQYMQDYNTNRNIEGIRYAIHWIDKNYKIT